MKSLKTILTATASASVLLMSTNAVAQSQPSDEVVSTGIRSALKKSLDVKRAATSVVDAITSEDIGKFPDNNVAESLARIPGITVSRQFGEGSAVSIRGASDEHTLTTLNGQNVASTGWYSQQAIDRSFNYSMLPSEMIASIEVYKSSQADLVEGGLGGTVNVKTRKPLDLKAHTAFANVKATGTSVSDKVDLSMSGLYSYKNEAGTIGLLASVAKSDYSLVRRGVEGLPSWGGRIAPVNFQQDRDRLAYDIVAQYAPNDALDISVHYLNLELGADGTNHGVFIPQDTSACATNPQGAPILCTSTNNPATFPGINNDGFWDVRTRLATMSSEALDLTIGYEGEGFKVTGQAGTTKAAGGTNFEMQMAYISGVGGAQGTIDATGDRIAFDLSNPLFVIPTQGNYFGWEGLQTGQIVQQPNTDEETYLQADVEFDTNFGAVNSIKMGVRFTDHDVENDKFRPLMPRFNGATEAANVDPSRFISGAVAIGHDRFSMPALNVNEALNYARSFIDGWERERLGFVTVGEKNFAAYIMGTFETERLRGNVGLRYVSTDAKTSFYAGDSTVTGEVLAQNNGVAKTLSTVDASYDDILPSVNIAYDVQDDIILRFAGAQTIARPNYNDMFGNQGLVGFADTVPGNESVSQGNVALLPFKSTQFELALEYYFSENSLISAGVFTKSLSNFPTFSNLANQSIGVVDPDSGVDNWLLQTKLNGQGGSVNGIELQFQHAMDNGLGFMANYTLADAKVDDADIYADGNLQMTDGSKHTVNAVVYYENDQFSVRGAYSWRDSYFIREIGFYGAREHQDYGQIDLSGTYHINDMFDVNFQVNNLLESDSIQVGRDQGAATFQRTSDGYPAYSYVGERRVIVGVSARF